MSQPQNAPTISNRKKRKKPFVSKQNRGITGKKAKPGRPTMPKQMKTPEMFYFRGYAFRTKKELKDRIKALLLKLNGKEITPESNAHLFQLLNELVARHPNYENWGNKTLTCFKVTRANTKKSPPILWATFKGNQIFRDVRWLRCVHKGVPSDADILYMSMHFAISDRVAPLLIIYAEPAESQKEMGRNPQGRPRKSKKRPKVDPALLPTCTRCGANKQWIDHVRPSHSGRLFHEMCRDFIESTEAPTPNTFYWEARKVSFRMLSSDREFNNQWQEYHQQHACISLLCETCRIDDWSNHFLSFGENGEPIDKNVANQ